MRASTRRTAPRARRAGRRAADASSWGSSRVAAADLDLDRLVQEHPGRGGPASARTAAPRRSTFDREGPLAPREVVELLLADPQRFGARRAPATASSMRSRSRWARSAAKTGRSPVPISWSSVRRCGSVSCMSRMLEGETDMPETPDDVLRALADPERLAIAGALARGDRTARLARRARWGCAERRVRQHLTRLTAAGVARLERRPPDLPPGPRDAAMGGRAGRAAARGRPRARRGERRRGDRPAHLLPRRAPHRDPDEASEAPDRARTDRARVRAGPPLRRGGGERRSSARSSPTTRRCGATSSTRGSSTATTASTGARAAASTSTLSGTPARVRAPCGSARHPLAIAFVLARSPPRSCCRGRSPG